MGKYNSSLTRVQPIFNGLCRWDKTGKIWLEPLLRLGNRSAHKLDNTTLDPLVEAPLYELPIQPPKLFLKWLLDNPDRLTSPSDKNWSIWGETTKQKRRALLKNDADVQGEALVALDKCLKIPQRSWWRLEGITRVDCTMKTHSAVIFIEGKRTEIGASKRVLWYPYRNQVLRNLDCASEYAMNYGFKDYFVIVIVEKDLVNKTRRMQEELESIIDPKTIEMSLPHLSHREREQLMKHYLGVTTWQDIAEKFPVIRRCLCGRNHFE